MYKTSVPWEWFTSLESEQWGITITSTVLDVWAHCCKQIQSSVWLFKLLGHGKLVCFWLLGHGKIGLFLVAWPWQNWFVFGYGEDKMISPPLDAGN